MNELNEPKAPSFLERAKSALEELVDKHGLRRTGVSVVIEPLSPQDAIGRPDRPDFPIVEGNEIMIEARFLDGRGQAFTDSAGAFAGRVDEVMNLPLSANRERALFIATLNALLNNLGIIETTLHCLDNAPEDCAAEIVRYIRREGALRDREKERVGLIGYNPAIAEALAGAFGAKKVCVTDLNRNNIGGMRQGMKILDGRTQTERLIRRSDAILVTGTTLVNGTFDSIWAGIEKEKKKGLVFGVTASGVCALTGLKWICPRGRNPRA